MCKHAKTIEKLFEPELRAIITEIYSAYDNNAAETVLPRENVLNPGQEVAGIRFFFKFSK